MEDACVVLVEGEDRIARDRRIEGRNRHELPRPQRVAGLSYRGAFRGDAEEVIPHISVCPDCQTTLQTFGDADDTLIAKLRSPAVGRPL